MIYELHFHHLALKEWKKLTRELQEQFKKILKRRLENPHVVSASLKGELKNCYKIKLHQAGYRLIYHVNDNKMIIMVIAVGNGYEITPTTSAQIAVSLTRSDLNKSAGVLVVHRAFVK